MCIMVAATRLLLIAITVLSVPLYFVFVLPEDILMQIAGAVVILLLVALILFTGGPSIPVREEKKAKSRKTQSSQISSSLHLLFQMIL